MTKTDQVKKKKMNPILFTLFAIIMPLIIVIVIVSVILGVAGFNVIDWAKEKGSDIPVVSNFLTTEEELDTQKEIERLTSILHERDVEIEQFNTQIEDLETNLAESEREKMIQEQSAVQQDDVEVTAEDADSADQIKQVAKTYEEMKSKNAAAILELMNRDEAISILEEIPNDVRGEILQNMDVEIAADITRLLMEE